MYDIYTSFKVMFIFKLFQKKVFKLLNYIIKKNLKMT